VFFWMVCVVGPWALSYLLSVRLLGLYLLVVFPDLLVGRAFGP
jgi:hypothetical protein